MTRCFTKKLHAMPSSYQAFHSNTTALGMSESSPLPTVQVSRAARSQAKHHKPVIGFAKFLLGEVCFLQGYDSEMQ